MTGCGELATSRRTSGLAANSPKAGITRPVKTGAASTVMRATAVRNWRIASSGLAAEYPDVRAHAVGQFLRDCRIGGRRADRIAVCRDDAAGGAAVAARGGSGRRIWHAHGGAFQRRSAAVGGVARAVA